jgi:enamine deaminase RidA (YjgF/YER057c/UK114 family)
MTRTNYSSGLPLEDQIGYSRAVKVGTRLYTSPTAPVDENLVPQGATGGEQAEIILQRLQAVFIEAGFSFDDVVAATIYVIDDPRTGGIYEVFSKYFFTVKPTVAVVNVRPWSHPDLLLEISLIGDKG